MPKKINANFIRVHIPANMAFAGWDFDVAIISRFMKDKGIKWPVKIRYTSGQYRVGCHRTKRDENGNFYHAITISQRRGIEFSTETLLHELCHAIQVERYPRPRDFSEEYRRAGGSGRYYDSNPFEIEARECAKEWAKEYPVLY